MTNCHTEKLLNLQTLKFNMRYTGNKEIEEELQGQATILAPQKNSNGKKLYIESYGCQMNFSDSEIVASILIEEGYTTIGDFKEADVILVNTCSIRDNAEQRVFNRLKNYQSVKKYRPGAIIGILGCMAERLKSQLLEKDRLVDLVVGPDAYRSLPELLQNAESGQKAVNVLLSREETYADIAPVRLDNNGISAFISIMRGCDNMCSFCVVPFTRGRERSRDPESIVHEARELVLKGYKEVTLLGQNVDSYKWNITAKGEVVDPNAEVVKFAGLLEKVAQVSPELRIRFSTSHPKDMNDDVLETMATYENICKCIHLPVQSGNNEILKNMNRGYTREWYYDRIDAIHRIIPDCAISTDMIIGFCDETDEAFEDTYNLMDKVEFDFAYMFKYSERPKTLAERNFEDNVPEEIKSKRLSRIIDLQRKKSLKSNEKQIGKVCKVLIEGESKRSSDKLYGRNTQNMVAIFDKGDLKKGQYVDVLIESCSSATLFGKAIKTY
jgi:tRNA-2-methylthio-N6-dimethylallyladenosine synthase